LLILLPGEVKDEETIRELSRIVSISAYDARLALSSPRPRLFRRVESEAEARRLSEELAFVRIPHYVVAEAAVTSFPIARASVLDLSDLHFDVALDGASKGARTPYGDLLLVVRGEIARERHDERKLGSAKGASRRLTPGLRLHLYLRDSSFAIEVDPDLFDFRALGEERTSSALLNFERFIARLLSRAPRLEVDRGFDHEPPVLSRAGGGDVTDALAASERGPSGSLYDNEESFRFYARWRYRLARHLNRLSGG
jgi:hypothetical protein